MTPVVGDEIVVHLRLSGQPRGWVTAVWPDGETVDADVDCGTFTVPAFGIRRHQSGEDPYWTWQPAGEEDEAELMQREWFSALGFVL